MVGVKKSLGESFNILIHNKKIVIPAFCYMVLPLILIYLFVQLSGFGSLVNEIVVNYNDFSKNSATQNSISNTPFNEEESFINYLNEKGYNWGRYSQLFNAKNLFLLMSFVIIGLAGLLYFSSLSYVMVMLAYETKKFGYAHVLRIANKLFVNLFLLRIFTGLIFILPLIFVIFLIIVFGVVPVLALLISFVLILLIIVYWVFMGLRLFFVTPILYLERRSSSDSIRHSYLITKGNLKEVFLLWLTLVLISLVMGWFINQPLYNLYIPLLFLNKFPFVFVSLLFMFFFLLLTSFAYTFQKLFLFCSYREFKKDKENQL